MLFFPDLWMQKNKPLYYIKYKKGAEISLLAIKFFSKKSEFTAKIRSVTVLNRIVKVFWKHTDKRTEEKTALPPRFLCCHKAEEKGGKRRTRKNLDFQAKN